MMVQSDSDYRNHRVVILTFLALAILISVLFISGWVINAITAFGAVFGIDISILKDYGALSYILSVDISTVTTVVFMITALCLTWGIWMIYRGKFESLTTERTEHFPFWRTYKTTYVELGLLGTLFGFIIAFSRTSASASLSDVERLLQALGTALWSTFAAIFMAFIICPLLEKPFNSIKNKRDTISVIDDVNKMGTAFAILSTEASHAGTALRTLTEEVQTFESNQNVILKLSLVQEQLNSVNGRIKQIEENIGDVKKNADDIRRLKSRVSKLESEMKRKEKLRGVIDEIKKKLEELD